MRAWIISDIHCKPMDSILGWGLQVPDADICICAGDIADQIWDSISYLRRYVEPYMPVILVLGNHDFYGSSIDFALDLARREIAGTRITLLENESIDVDDCRFIGATLWTDFAVSIGDDEHVSPEERRALAFGLVPAMIADFSSIYRSDERRDDENGMITVKEILERHLTSKSYIDQALFKPTDLRTIVITHHAPHIRSFDPRFYGQVTNAAFGSDLSDLITRRHPSLWIHGHIHRFRDYLVDKTRIICNPRGYGGERYISSFRPKFLVDL